MNKNINKTFYLAPLNDNSFFNNEMYKNLLELDLVYSDITPVNFIFIYGKYVYDKNKFDSKGSYLISLLSGSSKYNITDKIKFTNLFINEKFIYPSIVIKRDFIPNLQEPFIKIIKPDKGFQSSDIVIVKSNKEIYNYLKKIDISYNKFILQDYIIKPDLYNGYKFNLRIFILVKFINNKLTIFYTKYNYIKLSPKKYKESKFNDKGIHLPVYITDDYLQENSNKLLIYPINKPENYTDKDIYNIYNKINNYLKIIFNKENKFKPAWKAKNGFEIFGLDVIFENKEPYFLEINEKIGTFDIFGKIIPNITKSVIELTLLNKNYDKYNNFIKIK